MNNLSGASLFFISLVATFMGLFILVPAILGLARFFGLYTIVEERQCKVYVLFGKVLAVIDQPGLHLLVFKIGIKAPLINFLGKCHTLDLRLDQQYLRSTPVNS
jgi:regulator of protease activity HflC (stomatin/prohibitin superfamily)